MCWFLKIAQLLESYAFAAQSGSIVVDIWRDVFGTAPDNADSITASAPITLTSAQSSTDTTLTGWTKTLAARNILRFNIDSVTAITRLNILLTVS